MLNYIVLAIIAVYLILYLVFCYKTGHFLKTLILNVLIGIISLVVLNIISNFSGISVNINKATVSTSALLGVPGIFSMLVLNMIL